MNNSVLNFSNAASDIICPQPIYERHLRFYHEEDGCWYIDYPGRPVSHHNLMVVSGADELCDYMSDDGKVARFDMRTSKKRLNMTSYACLERGVHSLTGGAYYKVTNLRGFKKEIWLCPVTLFVLGWYPKYIYIKKSTKTYWYTCN